MKNKKYCQTLKPGFYLLVDPQNMYSRCVYASGKTSGNRWINLSSMNPEWTGLLWNCIDRSEIEQSTFFETNPTIFKDLKNKI